LTSPLNPFRKRAIDPGNEAGYGLFSLITEVHLTTGISLTLLFEEEKKVELRENIEVETRVLPGDKRRPTEPTNPAHLS
jgi:hypothetical protein